MKSIFYYFDVLAFEWIRRRAAYFIRGGYPSTVAHPLATIIANDVAGLINDAEAENGVIIAFHSGKHGRDVVFDVRWADGKTVHERYIEQEKKVDRMEGALEHIDAWSQAYPLSAFPEPDLKRARELLEAGGQTLDAISASNMRHVVKGVGKIARDGLGVQHAKQPSRSV